VNAACCSPGRKNTVPSPPFGGLVVIVEITTALVCRKLFVPVGRRVQSIPGHEHGAGLFGASQNRIDPALIERFGRIVRENFSTGSVPFRKAYLRSLIDVIEVDEHQVRIKSQNGPDWCSQTST
jgi:hypothetical protein